MVMIGMLIKTITKFVERDWLSPTQFKHKGQCRSQMPCSFFLFIALVQTTLITVQILRALRYLTLCNFALHSMYFDNMFITVCSVYSVSPLAKQKLFSLCDMSCSFFAIRQFF